jgi:hypothetical protein
MLCRSLAALSVAVGLMAVPLSESAQAQARTGQTSGLFGSRSLGGSSSSLGSSSRVGSTQGGGAGGFGGQGAGGLGAGGLGAGGGLGQTGGETDAGTLTGSERFIRGNRQQGSFVGRDAGDQGRFVGGNPAGGSNLGITFDPASGGLSIGPQDGRNAGGRGRAAGAAGQSRRIRAQRQVDFDYRPSTPLQVGSQLSARLTRIKGIRSLGPVTVEVVERTAILRGVVATDRDRVRAEQVALLESGISRVQNELSVGQLPSEQAEEPALRAP